MKPTLIVFLLALGLALVGCSAGETQQSDIEKDVKSIQTDPNATPVDSGATVAPGT